MTEFKLNCLLKVVTFRLFFDSAEQTREPKFISPAPPDGELAIISIGDL